jgi:predicted Rossmann-fold nucleotide-binding protein
VILVRCSSAASAIPAALCSALTSLARAVASEYGRRGITCNTVVLAGGDTAVMDAAVELVGFLLSDDAGYVTGDVIDLRT